MRKSKYIKMFWNEKFFEMPDGAIKSKMTALKFGFIKNKINLVQPFLFVCNKTTPCDKTLVSNIFKGNFVFLKDEVIQDIYDGKFSKEDYAELIDSFNLLRDGLISVVIFPEKRLTIFGKTGHIPHEISNLIFDSNFNVKFISLVGTYFAMPIWAKDFRHCETRFHQQFSFKHSTLEGLNPDQLNEAVNAYMPSSATTYSNKYNPYIRSNTKAQNLETLIYCCPNCKSFFSVYSEFNCLKCKECGTAVEMSSNGTILLSKNITDLDSFSDFQFDALNDIFFDDKKPMIEYSNVRTILNSDSDDIIFMGKTSISIFCNRLVIKYPAKDEIYKLLNVTSIEFDKNNTVYIYLKNKYKLTLCGTNKENFYIMFDLHRIIHKKKD